MAVSSKISLSTPTTLNATDVYWNDSRLANDALPTDIYSPEGRLTNFSMQVLSNSFVQVWLTASGSAALTANGRDNMRFRITVDGTSITSPSWGGAAAPTMQVGTNLGAAWVAFARSVISLLRNAEDGYAATLEMADEAFLPEIANRIARVIAGESHDFNASGEDDAVGDLSWTIQGHGLGDVYRWTGGGPLTSHGGVEIQDIAAYDASLTRRTVEAGTTGIPTVDAASWDYVLVADADAESSNTARLWKSDGSTWTVIWSSNVAGHTSISRGGSGPPGDDLLNIVISVYVDLDSWEFWAQDISFGAYGSVDGDGVYTADSTINRPCTTTLELRDSGYERYVAVDRTNDKIVAWDGSSWSDLIASLPTGESNPTALAIDPANGGLLMAGASTSKVYRHDGTSWSEEAASFPAGETVLGGLTFIDGGIVASGQSTDKMYSYTEGGGWRAFTDYPPGVTGVPGISVGQPNTTLLAVDNLANGRVHRRTGIARAWVVEPPTLSNSIAGRASGLTLTPSNNLVYADASDGGLYRYDGSDWVLVPGSAASGVVLSGIAYDFRSPDPTIIDTVTFDVIPPLDVSPANIFGGIVGTLAGPAELGPISPLDASAAVDAALDGTVANTAELGPVIGNKIATIVSGESHDFEVANEGSAQGELRFTADKGLLTDEGEFTAPTVMSAETANIQLRDNDTLQDIDLSAYTLFISSPNSGVQFWKASAATTPLIEDLVATDVAGHVAAVGIDIVGHLFIDIWNSENQHIDLVPSWETGGWVELNVDGTWVRGSLTGQRAPDEKSPYNFTLANSQENTAIGDLASTLLQALNDDASYSSTSVTLRLVLPDGDVIDTVALNVGTVLDTATAINGTITGTLANAVELGPLPDLEVSAAITGTLAGTPAGTVELADEPLIQNKVDTVGAGRTFTFSILNADNSDADLRLLVSLGHIEPSVISSTTPTVDYAAPEFEDQSTDVTLSLRDNDTGQQMSLPTGWFWSGDDAGTDHASWSVSQGDGNGIEFDEALAGTGNSRWLRAVRFWADGRVRVAIGPTQTTGAVSQDLVSDWETGGWVEIISKTMTNGVVTGTYAVRVTNSSLDVDEPYNYTPASEYEVDAIADFVAALQGVTATDLETEVSFYLPDGEVLDSHTFTVEKAILTAAAVDATLDGAVAAGESLGDDPADNPLDTAAAADGSLTGTVSPSVALGDNPADNPLDTAAAITGTLDGAVAAGEDHGPIVPTIANKIDFLAHGETHDYDVQSAVGATGNLRFTTDKGLITDDGVLDASGITTQEAATVQLRDGDTEQSFDLSNISVGFGGSVAWSMDSADDIGRLDAAFVGDGDGFIAELNLFSSGFIVLHTTTDLSDNLDLAPDWETGGWLELTVDGAWIRATLTGSDTSSRYELNPDNLQERAAVTALANSLLQARSDDASYVPASVTLKLVLPDGTVRDTDELTIGPNLDVAAPIAAALDGALAGPAELGDNPLDNPLDTAGAIAGALDGAVSAPTALGDDPLDNPADTAAAIAGTLDGTISTGVSLGDNPADNPVDTAANVSVGAFALAAGEEVAAEPLIQNKISILPIGQEHEFELLNEGSADGTLRLVADKGTFSAPGVFSTDGFTDVSTDVTVSLRDGDTLQDITLPDSWFSASSARLNWWASDADGQNILLDDDFKASGATDRFLHRLVIQSNGRVFLNIESTVDGNLDANRDLIPAWENGGWLEVTVRHGDDEYFVRVTNTGRDVNEPYELNPSNRLEGQAIRDIVAALADATSVDATLRLVLPDGDAVDTDAFEVAASLDTAAAIDGELDGAVSANVDFGPTHLFTAAAVDGALDGSVTTGVSLGQAPDLEISPQFDIGVDGSLDLEVHPDRLTDVSIPLSAPGTLSVEVHPDLLTDASIPLGADGSLEIEASAGSVLAQQAWDLTGPSQRSPSRAEWRHPTIANDAATSALLANKSQTAYPVRLTLSAGTSTSTLTLRLHPSPSGGGAPAGQDLDPAFLVAGTIIIESGSELLEISAADLSGDTSEPYVWTVSSSAKARFDAFVSGVGSAAADADLSGSLTLSFPITDIPLSVDAAVDGSLVLGAELRSEIHVGLSVPIPAPGTLAVEVHPDILTAAAIDAALDGSVSTGHSLGQAPDLETSAAIDGELDGSVSTGHSLGQAPDLTADLSVPLSAPGALSVAVHPDIHVPLSVPLSVDGSPSLTAAIHPHVAESELELEIPFGDAPADPEEADGTLLLSAELGPDPSKLRGLVPNAGDRYVLLTFRPVEIDGVDVLMYQHSLDGGEWVPPEMVDGDGTGMGFDDPIYRSARSGPGGTSAAPSILVTDLDAGRTYVIRVRPVLSDDSSEAGYRIGEDSDPESFTVIGDLYQSPGDLDRLGPSRSLGAAAGRLQGELASQPAIIYSDVASDLSRNDRITDLDAVFTSIENIFLTKRDERLFNLDLTADLVPLLFRPLSDDTAREIRERSIDAIDRHEPRVNVVANLTFVAVNEKDNGYDVDFVFTVDGFEDTANYQGFIPRTTGS